MQSGVRKLPRHRRAKTFWRQILLIVHYKTYNTTQRGWFSSHDDSRARHNLTEPIPLLVEHVAVEFVVEPSVVFEPWRHPPSDAVLTPAISPVTGRLLESGSVLFPLLQVHEPAHRKNKKRTNGACSTKIVDLKYSSLSIKSFMLSFYIILQSNTIA